MKTIEPPVAVARLLTVEQACEVLQLHEITLRRLCKQKRIPHLKIGGRYRFDFEQIRAALTA